MEDIVINARDIVKTFYLGTPNELEILHGMSFDVPRGQFVSIVGQSGSGKSTLMNIIGALDRPTSGTYFLDGTDISKSKDKELSEIRNRKIGFVFQTFNLISRTSALKNVELPMMYAGISPKERKERAMQLLEIVDMTQRAGHMPNELSGGQKQRVAIARAMANDPAIILADEPTGALDSRTGRLVMDLFHKLHQERNTTIVLITHNNELAEETDRIITIADGNIINDSAQGTGGQAFIRKPVELDSETLEKAENVAAAGEVTLEKPVQTDAAPADASSPAGE
ncbi:MAG: ABC transporter ATP-binding protein [Oscillospiraceae bacterium]|nr:ABC transporter ATP-binding protein [Oscillospiraceae bacterium]